MVCGEDTTSAFKHAPPAPSPDPPRRPPRPPNGTMLTRRKNNAKAFLRQLCVKWTDLLVPLLCVNSVNMLPHTLRSLRTKLGALSRVGHSHALAVSAAQRLQHAEAYEACGDALLEFRETVKDFAQRTIAPHAAEIDRLNSFPKSANLWKEIGEFGLHGALMPTMRAHQLFIAKYCLAAIACCLAGLTAPSDYGGLDVGYQHHCVAMEVGIIVCDLAVIHSYGYACTGLTSMFMGALQEISRASGSVGLSYGAHSNLCINQLVRNASQQQKQKYLPNLIAG